MTPLDAMSTLSRRPDGNGPSTRIPWWLYVLDNVRCSRPSLAHGVNTVLTDERDSHVVDRRRCPLRALGRRSILRRECGALLRDRGDHQEVRAPASSRNDD